MAVVPPVPAGAFRDGPGGGRPDGGLTCNTLGAPRAEAIAQARAALPHEAAGLLWARPCGLIVAATLLANAHPEPHRAVRLSRRAIWEQQEKQLGRGLVLAALWHSHPEGASALSAQDRRAFDLVPCLWVLAFSGRRLAGLHAFRQAPDGRVLFAPVRVVERHDA